MPDKKLAGLEWMLFLIFLLLFGMLLMGKRARENALWKSIQEQIPFDEDVFRENMQEMVLKLGGEFLPVLEYPSYEENDLPWLIRTKNILEKEVFPFQKYVVDYYDGSKDFDTKYGNYVPKSVMESDDESVEKPKKEAGNMEITGKGVLYTLKELSDYDFLINHFYIVDETTELKQNVLEGKKLVKMDLSMNTTGQKPLVLIYHTHGSESYKQSNGKTGTVIDVGEELKQQLENKYGIKVIHDTSVYDRVNGSLDRNAAYNFAKDGVCAKLKKYPSIKVVLDLHRDSVDESIHLTTKIQKKKAAQIMFFNGVSRRKGMGELTALYNPNQKENLAMSLKMQLIAAKYYPGFTRRIYIKGYRYNLHLVKRAMLIEVGAQNNTLEEAENAMSPLAEVLYRVLNGEQVYK